MPVASTNLKRDFGNTEGSLCYGIQLKGVKSLLVSLYRELTSANAAPYLMAFSKTLSVDSLISGE